ncbi:MAG TPA: proline--tRNA ligase [Fibrobacteria bacterium]|nr:proline--tRNA ligase [Fibrobacteria bacterium]
MQLVSKLFGRTLREAPSDAEMACHVWLARAGLIRRIAAGLYAVQPMGQRAIRRIESVIRSEMEAIGGQELSLPLVQPAELWERSGRYDLIGSELVRFKDRGQHAMVLAMTHEEAVTQVASEELSSHRQLPFMLWQFQLKFRDEPRARGGLIRVREFTMKDAYSFHKDQECLDGYYGKAYDAYVRIFRRCGIEPVIVQSDTGIMGGKVAHEFMLQSPMGEDSLILCPETGYSANAEIAVFAREGIPGEALLAEKVATPGKSSIEDVSRLLGIQAKNTLKMVMYGAILGDRTEFVAVAIRGDLDVSETKVRNILKARDLFPATDDQIRAAGLVPGFASPVGMGSGILLVDLSVPVSANLVAGANEAGFHVKNVNHGRDFESRAPFTDPVDVAQAAEGHLEIGGTHRLQAVRGIEIGNIFKLGTKFSEALGCTFQAEDKTTQPAIMGCYGIGVGRLLASIVENSHDENGIVWPREVTPYHVHIVPLGKEPEILADCISLGAELEKAGFDVLLDDRDERPGVKFKDADIWGIPVRLALGGKSREQGAFEWKPRSGGEMRLVPANGILSEVRAFYAAA